MKDIGTVERFPEDLKSDHPLGREFQLHWSDEEGNLHVGSFEITQAQDFPGEIYLRGQYTARGSAKRRALIVFKDRDVPAISFDE